MLTNVTSPNQPDPNARPPSTADEVINAIRLAREEFKSCELVINLRQALKLLRNLGYNPVPYRKGYLLNFEKANIYLHDP